MDVLKNSPPLLKLTLNRKSHHNAELLKLVEKETRQSKINTGKFLSNLKDASQSQVESEIVKIKPPVSVNSTKQSLSLETFESNNLDYSKKVIFNTPPIAPRRYNSLPKARSVSSVSSKPNESYVIKNDTTFSLNDNESFASNTSLIGNLAHLISLEIDLYKTQGKGLGIAVYGGPKSVITEGIKVCFLSQK